MKIFSLLQQLLLASAISRSSPEANHRTHPPKMKHTNRHQEPPLKEGWYPFAMVENTFMTTLNRDHGYEPLISSTQSQQLDQPMNMHRHQSVKYTKPHALHETRRTHSKKIHLSLRRPTAKAMAKPQFAALDLHQSSIPGILPPRPLARSKRSNDDLINAAQWKKAMRSTIAPPKIQLLTQEIFTGMAQLEAHPHKHNQASTFLRYSLLRYTQKHAQNLLEQWAETPLVASDTRLHTTKTLLQQLNAQLAAYERAVPQRLSTVWIGGVKPILQDYFYCIISAAKPGYQLTLFYDPNLTLAAALGKKIKEFAAYQKKDFVHPEFLQPDNAEKIQKHDVEKLVMNLQNQAYTAIKNGMNKGLSFDSCAINFMVQNLGEERASLEKLRQDNLNSYTQLNTIAQDLSRNLGNQFTLKAITKTLFSLPDDQPHLQEQRYNNYILEAGLRNNLAAASDLVRVFDLHQHGGTYRDIDLLPNVRDEILSSDPLLKKDLRRFIDDHIEDMWQSNDVLYGLQYDVLLQELASYLPSHQKTQKEKPLTIWMDSFLNDPEGKVFVTRLQEAIRHYKTTHRDIKDFFVPLDQIKVGPIDIAMQGISNNEEIVAVNNNMLAAQPRSVVLTQFIRKLDDTYALLQQPGMGMQYPDLTPDNGQPLPRHNNGAPETIQWAERNAWRKTQKLAPLTGEFELLPILPGLRLDGIDSESKATIFIGGPTSLSESISHYLYTSIGSKTYDRVNQALQHASIQYKGLFNYAKTLPQQVEGEYSSESVISSWISDAGQRQNNIADSTQYDHTLIFQLERDPQVNLAARFLNNKHPEKTTWLALTFLNSDQYKLDMINQPAIQPSNSNARIRVMVLGHGHTVDGKTQLSQKNGQQLANLLTDEEIKNKFLKPEQSITRISLVGCDLASGISSQSSVTTNGFVVDLFNNLKENGVSVKEVTARTGPVLVNPRGKKLVQLISSQQSSPQWQHHDGKIIFTQDSKGVVHYQSAPTYIDEPLPNPTLTVGSAGPLAWGAPSQRRIATKLAAQFQQVVSKIKTEQNFDNDWVPLLNTLEKTPEATKIQWLNTKDPSQGLRHTSAQHPIFLEIKTYADAHLEKLRATHQWVDNQLTKRPRAQNPQPANLFKQIERGANDLLAINTLIHALRHPVQTVESTLDKVLKLHSYLAIAQVTTALTAEGSRLFTQNLSNKNSATALLAKAEQFGIAVNHAANDVFNIANLSADVAELMLSNSPEQARHFAAQLGFDASISSSFAISGIAETLGETAIANVAGPVGWILMATEIMTLTLMDNHPKASHKSENMTAVNDYLDATLHQYRAGGFRFDENNKALVSLHNVIVEKMDFQHGITIMKSPTLRRIENVSVKNGTAVNIPKRVPLEFKLTFATVDDHDLLLSQYLPLPTQAAIQHLKEARTIVLPDTPNTRFDYTITPDGLNEDSSNNANLTHQLIHKPCQPCTSTYDQNLLLLWRSTRLASLTPNYQLTSTKIILDADPRTLIVPTRPFSHDYMLYEITGGGSTTTLIPQPGVKFLFNPSAQPSRWLIDARPFSQSSLHCAPGYFRIGQAEFMLSTTISSDMFMLKTQSNDLIQIDMRQGIYQYSVIDMHSKPLVDIYARLKNLARAQQLIPYVVLTNLPVSHQDAHQKTVALFDTQRHLLVPACVDGAVTVAGVGTKQQSPNPYFFAKSDSSILWRVNAKKQKIVMQWRPLLAEYQDMRMVGIYQRNNMTLLEQSIPLRYRHEMRASHSTIRLTSTINQYDAIKCIDIAFPADEINQRLDDLRSFLSSVASAHISNREKLIWQQILPINDLTPRTEPIEKVAAAQHLRQAGYARFVRLSAQENAAPQPSAWLWLEKARLLEPRSRVAGQTPPDFAQMLSVSEAEIPVGVTADGCYFHIHTDNHIELIGTSRSWITAHWETLSTDLDHMAQQTTSAAFITLSGLIEHTAQADNKKAEEIIPQRAWYDTQEKQFMIAPSHLNQAHTTYLGSDHDGGGWLYDYEQRHLYYVDLVNPALLKTLFESDLQAKVAHWQSSERLFPNQKLDNVIRQNDGRIIVCTNDGLIFLVDHHEEESGQGPLLLAVTSDWQDAHQATLAADLNILKLRYATNNKIEVVDTVNRMH